MMEVFKEERYNSPVIHSDETTFQVNKEPGKAASSKSYMWVLCSNNRGSPPTVLYSYRPTRAGEAASNLMKGYEGYLMLIRGMTLLLRIIAEWFILPA